MCFHHPGIQQGGASIASADPGATLRVLFQGTGIRVLYSRGPEGGFFSGWVDAGPLQTAEGYAENYSYGHVLAFAGLPAGDHALTVTNGDGAIWIEAVQVQGVLVDPFTPTGTPTLTLTPTPTEDLTWATDQETDQPLVDGDEIWEAFTMTEPGFYLSYQRGGTAHKVSTVWWARLQVLFDDLPGNLVGYCYDAIYAGGGNFKPVALDNAPGYTSIFADTSAHSPAGTHRVCNAPASYTVGGATYTKAQICAAACPGYTRLGGSGEGTFPKAAGGNYGMAWDFGGGTGWEAELTIQDGYFAVRSPLGTARFFLEVDRGTELLSKYAPQVAVYEAYVDSGQYQARFAARSLRILVVTTTPRRLSSLARVTQEAGGDRKYHFTTFDRISPETMLTGTIWRRLGADGLTALIEEE